MKLLNIGDNRINERYFIGLFDVEMGLDTTSGKYKYTIEARWLEGDKVMGQAMGGYLIEPNDSGEEEHQKAMEDAMGVLGTNS